MTISRLTRRDSIVETTRRRPLVAMTLCAALALAPLLSLNQPKVGAASAHDAQSPTVQPAGNLLPSTNTNTSVSSSGPGFIGQQIFMLAGGPPVTLTAVVKSIGSGGAVPTGAVAFYDLTASSTVPLSCPVPLVNGQATFYWFGVNKCTGTLSQTQLNTSGLDLSSLLSQIQPNLSGLNLTSLLSQAQTNLSGLNVSSLLGRALPNSSGPSVNSISPIDLLYGPSVGNHLIQARYIPNPGFLPSQSGYVIQSVRTCSASGVLPTNGQMGLLASVTNGATPSSMLQFRAASQGFTANSAGFTVNNAQVVACFNPDPNFGVAIALGTIAKRVGDSIPSNISNNLGQPQVGDVVLLGLLHIDTYSFGLIGTATINGLTFGTATPSNCIYNSNVCNLWANVFFPPYNSAAGITITTP